MTYTNICFLLTTALFLVFSPTPSFGQEINKYTTDCPLAKTSTGGTFHVTIPIDNRLMCEIENDGTAFVYFPSSEISAIDYEDAYYFFQIIGGVQPGFKTYITFERDKPNTSGLKYTFKGFNGSTIVTFTYIIDGYVPRPYPEPSPSPSPSPTPTPTDPDAPTSPTDPTHVEPCNCIRERPGSVIRIDNLSFGESVPIVGAEVFLSYSSELMPEYVVLPSLANSRIVSFNPEGWSINLLHYYDTQSGRLYHGSGRSFLKTSQPISTSEIMVVDGDEVYIFDANNGRHLRTRSTLTGYIKYSNVFDSAGRLIRIDDAFGNQTHFSRNGSGTLQSVISPFGKITSIEVNSAGLINKITNPKGEFYSVEYKQGTSLLEKFIRPSGKQTTVNFDNRGRLKETIKSGKKWSYELMGDGDGLYMRETSPSGKVSKYRTGRSTFDGSYERWEKKSDGSEVLYREDLDGGSTTDLEDETIHEDFVPDERFGSLQQKLYYKSSKKSDLTKGTIFSEYVSGFSGDPFSYSQIEKWISINGKFSHESVFDKATMVETVTSAEGVIAKTKIDSFERPIELSRGNETPYTIEYDLFGRFKKMYQGVKRTLEYFYDSAGNIEKVRNARNEEFSFTYDLAGRLTASMLPNGSVTQYYRDGDGLLIGVKPPGKLVHELIYNDHDLLSQYSPPAIQQDTSTRYKYNDDNQIIAIQTPGNDSINYVYDEKGLLREIKYGRQTQNYLYKNSSNKVISARSFDNVVSRFQYFGDEVSLEEQDLYHGGGWSKVQYRYDNFHRADAIKVSSNFIPKPSLWSHVYDDDSRLIKVGDLQLNYNANGRLYETFIGKVLDRRVYDSFGDLLSYTSFYKENENSSPSELYSYTLTRDLNGRVISKTEKVLGVTSTFQYEYDTVGRLTRVIKDGGQVSSYSYDLNGNKISGIEFGKGFTATYDAQDRLLQFRNYSYEYNLNGDLVSVQSGINRPMRLSYGPFGKLKQVVLPTGESFSYVYDSSGRRIFNSNVRIIYDSSRPIVHYNSNDHSYVEYVYASASHSPDYIVRKGKAYRLLKDHLGSPRLVISVVDGTVMQRIDYDVWGKITFNSNKNFQHIGFAGGVIDSATGLIRFGVRDYDPYTGRWTSKDPILFEAGDPNLYGYVANDPVNAIDPTGLYQVCTRALNGMSGEFGPFYHQYLCANGVCGGQSPSGSAWGSPGADSNDGAPGSTGASCKEGPDDNKGCMDKCIAGAIGGSRPNYSVINVGGSNCQKWANDTVSRCAAQCGGK